MSEIKVTGNKKLKTLSKEFQEKFPYLFLAFLDDTQQDKAEGEGGRVTILPYDKTLSQVRKIKPKNSKEISIHGRTKVSTLEKRFKEEYGINVQVSFADGKNAYYTSGELNEMTLSQLNRYLEENGYKKNPQIKV